MKMKKWISLLLSAVMTLGLLTACGGGQSSGNSGSAGSSGAQATDVLYHVYHAPPYVTLDPSTEYSNGILVLQNVYETLTYYNSETGELEPCWPQSGVAMRRVPSGPSSCGTTSPSMTALP